MLNLCSRCIGLFAVSVFLFVAGCQAPESQRDGNQVNPAMLSTLKNALSEHQQIMPVTEMYDDFSMETGYTIQSLLAEKMQKKRGPVIGYKVAYASKAAQEQFGMDEPARGPYYLSQRVVSGSTLPVDTFNEIMLETEIAFTIDKRIDDSIPDVKTLKPFVASLHAAFDAGDFPYSVEQAKPVPADMIAIGTGAHIFILGPENPIDVNIDDLTLKVIRNGETIRQSSSKEVMGSPWNSLLWCANHLVKHGKTLEPGMVVLCGTAAPAYKVNEPDAIQGEYVGDCDVLGSVSLTLK